MRVYPGLDFLEKKTGHTLGRDQNERITDGARGLYEKETGYVSTFFLVVLFIVWDEKNCADGFGVQKSGQS